MENGNNSNKDCCCGDGGCCSPQKSSIWKKLIFVLIILGAGAIITMKLLSKDDAPTKCCDPAKGSSCCPQSIKDSTLNLQPFFLTDSTSNSQSKSEE